MGQGKNIRKGKKFNISLKPRNYLLEELLIIVGIVMVWRGIWILLDFYFFPHSETLSAIFSVVIGLILVYLPDNSLESLK